MKLDLNIAFKKLHELQFEDGDLGAAYWSAVAKFLKDAESFRDRAIYAESKLMQINNILNARQSSFVPTKT
ncbi:hypothetical protein ABT364_05575 [Massilia sp. SR12]